MAFSTHDQVPDSPTNVFCTLNPLVANPSSAGTLQDGNLKINHVTNGEYFGYSTIKIDSSKIFYVEALLLTDGLWGITKDILSSYGSGDTTSIFIGLNEGGIIYENGGSSAADSNRALGYGDVLGLLIDGSALSNNLKWYRNNILKYQHTYDLTSNDFQILVGKYSNSVYLNFGQDPTFGGNKNTPATVNSVTGPFAPSGTAAGTAGLFYYPPPTDALALCTANLPDPDIDPAVDDLPEDYFKAVKYVGDYSSPATISVGFNPDLVWIKQRTPYASQSHCLYDSVRGVSKRLYSDSTSQEITPDGNGGVTNFSDNNGFELTRPTNAAYEGFDSSQQMIAWCWKAGGNSNTFNINGTGYSTYSALQTANTSLPASSTSGMIVPSGMSINTDAGFSIVKYPGTGETATVPHGLDKAPEMVIIKKLTTDTGGNNWAVYHKSVNENYFLYLNGTLGKLDYPIWNDTPPSSTVITLGDDSQVGEANRPNIDSICYAWHSVENYSKFGSYTGNGSPDGPFIYCGFRPAFVMIKPSSATGPWLMLDNGRDTFNQVDRLLRANAADAETGSGEVDLLPNGFKYKGSSGNVNYYHNQPDVTYIFMAFAEQPFKFSNAR